MYTQKTNGQQFESMFGHSSFEGEIHKDVYDV